MRARGDDGHQKRGTLGKGSGGCIRGPLIGPDANGRRERNGDERNGDY